MRRTMNQQIIFVGLALFLILGQQSVEAKKSYCDISPKHIACQKNTSAWGPWCGKDARLMDINKDYVLQVHNDIRNAAALNLIKGYDSAAAMPALKWDDELAELACISAHRCVYDKDDNRSTEKYPTAGQTMQILTTEGQTDENIGASQMMSAWVHFFGGNMDDINSFPSRPREYFEKFAQVVYDKNDAVGCCMERDNEAPNSETRLFICNYGKDLVSGEPVYESGPAASKCELKHETYSGLCA